MFLLAANPRVETRVEWLHAPEAWIVMLIILPAILLGVWWIYRGERGTLKPWGRFLLVTLRGACLLAILTFLCEPILTRERVQREDSTILLLIDDSYSMGISDRFADPELRARLEQVLGGPYTESTRRLDLVKGFLASAEIDFIERLRRKGIVRVAACSSGVRIVADLPRLEEGAAPEDPALDLDSIELRGKVTRIGDSLSEAVNELRGETVAAVVLLSDGRDNGGVVRPEEAAFRLGKREIPVHVIGVGNAEEPKDLRVFGLDIAEVVLEGDVVTVDFKVVSEGFEGESVKAELKLVRPDGGVEQTTPRFVSLTGKGEIQPVRMQFRPRNQGRYLARIELAHKEGELFRENNAEERPITVLAQKIKVLYVEGPPRYDYRYLMHALIRDPTMAAQILLTTADPEFLQESSPGLEPLREFPRTREDLFEYHLVIIGDIHPDSLSTRQKEWLVEFVDDQGGGVVFIAGQWYLPHRFRGDPLERLFPVELPDAETSIYEGSNLRDDFHVLLTPEGREHPVMRLTATPEENLSLWEESGRSDITLPGFYWFAKVKRLKRGAVALAVHESEGHLKYGPRPIFAYQYLGRGRTFISLTDDTWRMRLLVGNKWFYRFWGQIIRFTSAGRLLGKTRRFSVSTDQNEYTLGAEVRILARALDSEFKPTREEERILQLERVEPRGEGRTEVTAAQNPARPEYYEATVEARELGDHRVTLEEAGEEVASAVYRVVVPELEYAEPRMDRPRLEEIAKLSAGSYHEIYDAASIPDGIDPIEREIPISSETEPLWNKYWLLLLFVALLALEWMIRKGFRLL
ncbi:MAG: VWA domain-containing protein [Planctomycetota bacterium]